MQQTEDQDHGDNHQDSPTDAPIEHVDEGDPESHFGDRRRRTLATRRQALIAGSWVTTGVVFWEGFKRLTGGTTASEAGEQSGATGPTRDAYHYAANDSELGEVLADANNGEVVELGAAEFTEPRSIDTELTFIGTGIRPSGTTINSEWTLQEQCYIEQVRLSEENPARIIFGEGSAESSITNVASDTENAEIRAQANEIGVHQFRRTKVVFEAGTAEGIVDGGRGGSVVIDNGNNRVGSLI